MGAASTQLKWLLVRQGSSVNNLNFLPLFMKKIFLLLISFLFICSVVLGLFVLFSQYSPLKKEKTPESVIHSLPTPSLLPRLIEVKSSKEHTEAFIKNFGKNPPDVYAQRIKAFKITPKSNFPTFHKEVIIFPYSLYVAETLNISCWTQSSDNERVEKVVGVIDFGQGNEEKFEFFPIKTLRNNEQFIEKMWLGATQLPSEIPPHLNHISVKIDALNKEDKIVDEIEVFVEIKS